MPKRKKEHNPNQLDFLSLLFPQNNNHQQDQHDFIHDEDKIDEVSDRIDSQSIIQKKVVENLNLYLPFSYEEIIEEIGDQKYRLPDLIVPVEKFEEQIIEVVYDMKNSGYLLFLYGVSGVGKSTFISSLKFQKYIPIKEIVSIDASELISLDYPTLKLQKIIQSIKNKSDEFFLDNEKSSDRLCIVIDYLENLEDEDQKNATAFFRDLNALLRKYSILVIWPITVRKDLEKMQNFAKDYSSTIFHHRKTFIYFTGPPLEEYPNIAKKTIKFFNEGKECYDFQLNDKDLDSLKNNYKTKPPEKHLIRDYLKDVQHLWEDRTNHISKIVKSIPKATEVWFIFAYPEAEGVVARFAKQIPENINEMWNAEYNPLQPYITDHGQRRAYWTAKRLTLALNSRMLTTKIMYLPTNALISCIVAYADDAEIKISREEFKDPQKYDVPKHWFNKKMANSTLQRTPLYLQLSGSQNPMGKRKSGTVGKALNSAKQAFSKINQDISGSQLGKIGDQPFNKAICLALENTLSEYKFKFRCEQYHPHLRIKPDITVETIDKIICLEFCYTANDTPGNLADYVLRKLKVYMQELAQVYGMPQD